MKIALTGRLANPRNTERILHLIGLLEARGASLCCASEFAEMLEKAAGTPCAPKERFSGELPGDVSMLLALGGDGTFLGSLELLAGRDIPVAGINFGRLGFLTSAAMDSDSPEWVDDLLKGRYSLIEREILKVESTSALPEFTFCPPAPLERKVSQEMRACSISTLMVSSTNGVTNTLANEVIRLP